MQLMNLRRDARVGVEGIELECGVYIKGADGSHTCGKR